MIDYLLFRLYGPLASWGEIAVGESRHSAAYPSKSALLGLLGAAVGLRRDDDPGQQALARSYLFAVKLCCVGMPLRDFHTIQAPPQQRKTRYRTRRQELADPRALRALLSNREYRCDSLSLIVAQALPGAPYTLDELVQALRRPHFPLYLGRKSCPPALPLGAQKIRAPSVREALDDTPQPSLLSLLGRDPHQDWPAQADQRAFSTQQVRYYWEDDMQAGMTPNMQLTRNDQPLSRRRWQFAPRREWLRITSQGDV